MTSSLQLAAASSTASSAGWMAFITSVIPAKSGSPIPSTYRKGEAHDGNEIGVGPCSRSGRTGDRRLDSHRPVPGGRSASRPAGADGRVGRVVPDAEQGDRPAEDETPGADRARRGS